MKPTQMPSKKKKWCKKSEKRGEERKQKLKVQIAVSLLNPPQKNLKILLSAPAWTSQANILHLDQKATKFMTCKQLFGKLMLFIEWQWPENHLNSFKMHFFQQNLQGWMG